jgi:hypothetical protein
MAITGYITRTIPVRIYNFQQISSLTIDAPPALWAASKTHARQARECSVPGIADGQS